METRWVVAGLVALAALALALTGGTYSAPTMSLDVNGNELRAGALRLDLSGGDARAELSFPGLLPGNRTSSHWWLVTNDLDSPVDATVSVTFDHLRDHGVAGRAGILSRLLQFDLAVGTGPHCDDATTTAVRLPVSGPGNLRSLAAGTGMPVPIRSNTGAPVSLAPGDSVCLEVSAFWPPGDDDNAAQGDTLTVGAVVRLTQVPS